MFDDLTKSELYAILAGVFTASLIISNIIAGKPLNFFLLLFPAGLLFFHLFTSLMMFWLNVMVIRRQEGLFF